MSLCLPFRFPGVNLNNFWLVVSILSKCVLIILHTKVTVNVKQIFLNRFPCAVGVPD